MVITSTSKPVFLGCQYAVPACAPGGGSIIKTAKKVTAATHPVDVPACVARSSILSGSDVGRVAP
jgi:hypothetical protein